MSFSIALLKSFLDTRTNYQGCALILDAGIPLLGGHSLAL